MRLENQIGRFTNSSKIYTAEDLRARVLEIRKEITEQDFIDWWQENENGNSCDGRGVNVIHYDFIPRGIGSVFVELVPNYDEEEFTFEYEVNEEFEGSLNIVGAIALGNEDSLINALHDTLLVCTKEFDEYLSKRKQVKGGKA